MGNNTVEAPGCFGCYSYTHIICKERCEVSQSCKNKSACSSPQPVPKCFGDYGKEHALCNDRCDLTIPCVENTSAELLNDRRKQAVSIIKQQLQRMEQLAIDVRNLEKELRKKQEKLVKAKAKMDKIKAGDWSLISDEPDRD